MVGVGEPVYNTEQRREILRQMKQYFDEEWLKRRAKGRLSKKKIILPNAKVKKEKRKRKRRIRVFKIKIIKRKNKKYKIKNGRHFKRSNR